VQLVGLYYTDISRCRSTKYKKTGAFTNRTLTALYSDPETI